MKMFRKFLKKFFLIKLFRFRKYIIYSKDLTDNLSYSYDTSELEIKNLDNTSDFENLLNFGYKIKIWDKNLFLKYLNNKCIAIIISKNMEIIHTRWIATNKYSKKMIEPWPLKINWNNSACWGNALTHKDYRGKSINKISYYECSKYLKGIGKRKVFWTVQAKNKSNHKSYLIFNPKIVGFGYIISILWVNFRYSRFI